jgi:hypothetical protein
MLVALLVFPTFAFGSAVFPYSKTGGENSKFFSNHAFSSQIQKLIVEKRIVLNKHKEFLFSRNEHKPKVGALLPLFQCLTGGGCTSFQFPRQQHFHSSRCGHTTTEVPIPAAAWLFGSGLLALGLIGKKRRKEQ